MQLLGVQVRNFACFEQQGVSLYPGINLVVGRNNSGKTALLRALATLPTLPIGSRLDPRASADGYVWDTNERRHFEMDIIFRYEWTDAELQTIFVKFEEAANLGGPAPVARYNFKVYPGANIASLLSLEIELNGTSYPVLSFRKKDSPDLVRFTYSFPSMTAVDNSIGYKSSSTKSAFGYHFDFSDNDPYLSPLKILKPVVYIDSHRVATNSMLLQSVHDLSRNAQNLPGFLQTLQGAHPRKFQAIERFITDAFPEFEFLNPESVDNSVTLKLRHRETEKKIPLTHCGTGVEQLLSLATFIVTAPPSIVLIDEPHVFLHPSAERTLLDFMQRHLEHRYVITTHSAVLVNSVEPNRINFLQPPGRPFSERSNSDSAEVLLDLGYRNSDALFCDRLIFVEGKSDKVILPILLQKSVPAATLRNTGFVVMDGAGDPQVAMLHHEKIIRSLGRARMPRLYLFDGDKATQQRAIISKTLANSGETLPVAFLPEVEIENLLLVPSAIAAAINAEAAIADVEESNADPKRVAELLERFTASKGSMVLSRVYDHFGRRYNKERSGLLIAKNIDRKNQPKLNQLLEILRPVFEQ